MSRIVGLAAVVAALALPGAAVAASPIPGAHYEGTTEDSYPISFDVSPDGASITNVVTTAYPFCFGNGQAYNTTVSTNSTYLFPVADGTISGEDTTGFPRLVMRGSFTSPNDASGTFDTNHAGGALVFCNALDRDWTAHTNSAAPGGGGGGDPGGGGGGGGDPVPNPGGGDGGGGGAQPTGAPVISIVWPRGVLLQPSLKNGFIVTTAVDQAARVAGTVSLRAADARRYRLGKKVRVIARDSVANGGPDTSLEFKPSKAVARKLRKAKKLKLLLVVKATRADGVSSTAKKTLAFK
jgi:hypothetical protein